MSASSNSFPESGRTAALLLVMVALYLFMETVLVPVTAEHALEAYMSAR